MWFSTLRTSTAVRYRSYFAAAAVVAAAFVARYLLQPVLGGNHAYSLSYPVVLLCAYALGRGPAIFAAALSGGLAFWTFVEPRYGFSLHVAALTPLAIFGITTGVAIYLITGLTSALSQLAVEQGRLQAVADAHAGLFRSLQGRIGHHMRLLVGALAIQAHGEPDPEVLALIRRVGARSQLIARIHSEVAGPLEPDVEFGAFAKSLARMVCAEARQPDERIEVQGQSIVLPPEAATSLGVALAECLSWVMSQRLTGVLRVRLEPDPYRLRVLLSHVGDFGADAVALAPATYMFRAMVEQLGAVVTLALDASDGPGLEISLPLAPAPGAVPFGQGVALGAWRYAPRAPDLSDLCSRLEAVPRRGSGTDLRPVPALTDSPQAQASCIVT